MIKLILVLGVLIVSCVALDNGLARKPPMGWNSWNKFYCDISDAKIRDIAKTIATNGMKEAGYEYINVDDCWQTGRNKDGSIIPDPKKFPNMKKLADYVHSLGLKFGVYTDVGNYTCQKRPGSYNYEFQDAMTYASWGVDYVKVDYCYHPDIPAHTLYEKFRDAFNATNHKMVLSICNWGNQEPWKWGMQTGNLWRTTGDIECKWDSIRSIINQQVGLSKYSGPGGWNDPDMLEIGNNGINFEESKTHMMMWSILAAPLIAGNDVTSMSKETLSILTAPEIIAVNQDEEGLQGDRIYALNDGEVWSRRLSDGSIAVVCMNAANTVQDVPIDYKLLGLEGKTVAIRDLWQREDLGFFDSFTCKSLPPHGSRMLKIVHYC